MKKGGGIVWGGLTWEQHMKEVNRDCFHLVLVMLATAVFALSFGVIGYYCGDHSPLARKIALCREIMVDDPTISCTVSQGGVELR